MLFPVEKLGLVPNLEVVQKSFWNRYSMCSTIWTNKTRFLVIMVRLAIVKIIIIFLGVWGIHKIFIHPLILPTFELWVGTSSRTCSKGSLASENCDKFSYPEKMGQPELKPPLGWIFSCSKRPSCQGGSTHCQKVGFEVGLAPTFAVGRSTDSPKLKHGENPLQKWRAKWPRMHSFDPLLKSGFSQWVDPLSRGGSFE